MATDTPLTGQLRFPALALPMLGDRRMLAEDKPTHPAKPIQYFIVAGVIAGLGIYGATAGWHDVSYLPNPYIFIVFGVLYLLGLLGSFTADEEGFVDLYLSIVLLANNRTKVAM